MSRPHRRVWNNVHRHRPLGAVFLEGGLDQMLFMASVMYQEWCRI